MSYGVAAEGITDYIWGRSMTVNSSATGFGHISSDNVASYGGIRFTAKDAAPAGGEIIAYCILTYEWIGIETANSTASLQRRVSDDSVKSYGRRRVEAKDSSSVSIQIRTAGLPILNPAVTHLREAIGVVEADSMPASGGVLGRKDD